MIFFSTLLATSLTSYLNATKKKEYISYKIPDLKLLFFSENHKDILVNYLSKSSEWHVFPIYETVIAIRRDKDRNCKPLLLPYPSSYPNETIPPIQNNFLNLFPDRSLSFDKSRSLRYDLSGNKAEENTEIRLAMEKTHGNHSDPHSLESNLVVESKDKKISLHVYESSRDTQRSTTTKYLVSVSKELEKLARITEEDQYVDDSLLPLGSTVISSDQVIEIQKIGHEYSGEYSVSGYINPGEKGIIYLKVINKKTGGLLLSDKKGTNAEYVGWSSNLNKKFKFCLGTRQLAATRNDGIKVLAEFQLWFKPSNNSSEKMLDKQTLLVDVMLK